MGLVFTLQAIIMGIFAQLSTVAALGLNYGLVFTAWGVGGVIGPILAGWVADSTGSYTLAYQIAAGLCIVAAILSLVTKSPEAVQAGRLRHSSGEAA